MLLEMRKIQFILFFFSAALLSNAQAPVFQWAKNFPGSQNFDRALTVDGSGNVFTSGWLMGTNDFDPGPSTYNLTSSGPGIDIFISKLDSSGNFVWAKQIDGTGSGNTQTWKMATDVSGNLYLTGTYQGTHDFDPGTGVYNLSTGTNTMVNMFVLKLDPNGIFIWAKNMPGPTAYEYAYSIHVDLTGNVYTTGVFNGTADFDPGVGIDSLTALNYDVFISKLDGNGNFLWAKNFGGIAMDESYSVSTDNSGNVYLTGEFNKVVDFDPGPGTFTMNAVYANNIFILKLTSSGNFIWAKQLMSSQMPGGGTGGVGWSIATDPAGNSYSMGNFEGIIDFDPGPAVCSFTCWSVVSQNIYILKLDPNGNFVWARQIGNSGGYNAQGFNLALDGSNNIYVNGNFTGVVDVDPGVSVYNLTSAGSYDAFILKLNSSGNFLWAGQIGGTSQDQIACHYVENDGDIYSTGYFTNTADFDPGLPIYSLTTPTNTQIVFVQKLGRCLTAKAPVNFTPVSNQNICSNDTGTLTAYGSAYINWYSSPTSTNVLGTGTNYIISPLSPGTYTYYAEGIICQPSTTRTPITFTVNSSPSVTASSSNSLICAGQAVTLTASGATSYTFNPGGITGNPIAPSPTVSTTYTVLGSNGTCTNSAFIVQNVSTCTGIDQLVGKSEMEFYPNPNSGWFNIYVPFINATTRFEIYNCLGSLIRKELIQTEKTEVDLGKEPDGLYFVKIITDNKVVAARKIIKQ